MARLPHGIRTLGEIGMREISSSIMHWFPFEDRRRSRMNYVVLWARIITHFTPPPNRGRSLSMTSTKTLDFMYASD